MNLRHGRAQEPDVTLTPLIDIVFLLLIFFMVSTTFERNSELSIELPEATAKQEKAKDEPIEIAIDAKGRYYVDGKQLVNTQAATIKQALQKAADNRKTPPVVVNADAKTPYQAVVTVMDAARQLGFVHLTFAARLVVEQGESTGTR